MAHSEQGREKERVPPQATILSATALSHTMEHQTRSSDQSQCSDVQLASGNGGVAEDETSFINQEMLQTALTAVRYVSEENKLSLEPVGSTANDNALKGVSSSAAALKAPRMASSASCKIMDYTPLSSLPSSGSLMRHIFELRRRQQEQRRKLDASIQSASPTLVSGGTTNSTQSATVAADPCLLIQQSEAVGGSAFLTSTPQSATLGTRVSSKYSSDLSSIPSSLAIETHSRRPLSHLPLDRVPFELNTNSVSKQVTPTSQVSANTKVLLDENYPPDLFHNEQHNSLYTSSSHYNPNVYRSPPKKTLEQENNIRLTSHASVRTSKSNMKDSPTIATPSINESLVGLDDRPIASTNKSFENLVLEKIKAGVYCSSPTDTPAPKKTFLRKGTGTARFESANNNYGMKESSVQSPTLEASQQEDGEVEQKVKFPFLRKGTGNRRFNSKSIKLKKSTVRPPTRKITDRMGCEDKLTLEEPCGDQYSTPIRPKSLHAETNVMPTKSDWGGGQFSPITRYPKKEREELAAFERLEELADNTSLSSHASTVNSLLQKGLDASTSTPTDSPCPTRNRILDNLTPRKNFPWTNPLQSLHQATSVAHPPRPDTQINYNALESLAHEVAGLPLPDRVSKQQTISPGGKKARTVQFSERGAQILEYCVSDCDTASEAPTASDASEYLNMSDLEALSQLNREGKLPASCVSAQYVENRKHFDKVTVSDDDSFDTVIGTPRNPPRQPTSILNRGQFGGCKVSAGDVERPVHPNIPGDREKQAPRHTVLQFSPPKMPPNAASHPIWEAFGSKTHSGNTKSARNVGTVKQQRQQPPPKLGKASSAGQEQEAITKGAMEHDSGVKGKQAELEAHKVLLVSKVHELEREITSFQTENAQLSKLKDTLKREKEQLCRERKMFEVAVKEDRCRMEEYFEREKRKLWTEKRAMESSKETVDQKNSTLEIINLKEEILLLKRELDRKNSIHNFTQNKLKERIKELDQQKKDCEKKTEKVGSLEKENMSLKHQVDRLKLANKLKPTRNLQSVSKDQKADKPQANKSVSFADSLEQHNVPILNIKSKNRNSSFFANNFGGSLPDVATTSSIKPAPSNGSPYDNYLSRTPFSVATALANTDTPEQDSDVGTSTGNNCSLNSSESVFPDGSKVTTFANGNKKQVFPSGRMVLEYCNGDWEETLPGRATVYYYSETGTRQTTHHDSGLEEVEFSDGVTEKRLPDGSVDVSFPDGSRTLRRTDGSEEVKLTNGTLVVVAAGGAEKVLHLPNGQREVHGDGFKRREYPDGTVKVLYDDGSTKTTYPGGRVRVKDKEGNLVSDSKHGLDMTPSSGHQSC